MNLFSAMKIWIPFWIFSLCYHLILFPLGFVLVHGLWLFLPKKLKDSVKLKWTWPFSTPRPISSILVHAASGEIEYAKSLIRELLGQRQEQKIIVSFSSPSLLALYKEAPSEILLLPLPFDFYPWMLGFLSYYRVQSIYIARSDVWLGLAHASQTLNIPIYLFSVTQTAAPSVYKKILYTPIKTLYTVSSKDREQFKATPYLWDKTITLGDTRFDQVFYRLQQPSRLTPHLRRELESGTCLTLGSLWPEDEAVITSVLDGLIQSGYRVIWAPHEIPHHTALAFASFQSRFPKLRCQRLSTLLSEHQTTLQAKNETDPTLKAFDLLWVDQIGYLAELYHYSVISFVGGSFKSKVHSVMEPLAAGNLVCVGPFHRNNREAIDYQIPIPQQPDFQFVTEIHHGQTLLDLAQKLQRQSPLMMKQWIAENFKMHQGSSKQLVEKTLKG